MATYLADRVIVFEGTPSVETTANSPQSLLSGMNKFLESLEITFRRDPQNYRPRINKLHSVKVCFLLNTQKGKQTMFYKYFPNLTGGSIRHAINCKVTVRNSSRDTVVM